MNHSLGSVLIAAGSAAIAGSLALVAVFVLSRRSLLWAVRLAPLVAIASMAGGVVAASWTMLLDPGQARVIALVLAVSIPIAITFGIFAGRRVADTQREAVELAAARERDKGIEDRRRELIAWLSHDVRTPLARMRALTEAQEDGLAPPDYPTRMSREVDALTVIIDDIATLSRLHSPATELATQTVDLSDLVSDAAASNQPLADRFGIVMDTVAPGAVLVAADPAELSRAINNLIVNAIRHTRPDGFVGILVRQVEAGVEVGVQDQCGGIPEHQLDRLFEAGWRGTTARTPGDAGAGLGLNITARVAQAHGGTVTVRNVGDGCAFTLCLPPALGDDQSGELKSETQIVGQVDARRRS